jgi:hypothetical protein
MSERRDHKKSKRRRKDRDDDEDGLARGSGVNYSKVADRHVDDDRYEKHRLASTEAAAAPTPVDASKNDGQAKVSAQMAAVMRLMAGKEERTIAEKLADSNRPTWEQYKKDNEDKLNIEGLDKRKMEEYRKQLDEQREKLLTRGTNHRKDDEKKSKKKKKKRHRRHDDSYSDDSSSSESLGSDKKSRKRKKHRKRSDRKKNSRHDDDSDSSGSRDDKKRSKHHKKKRDKKRKRSDDGSGSGDSYRLSSFFNKGSDDDSKS